VARIAHLADLHVTEGPRLQDQADTLTRVVDDVVAARPDLVILAGDLSGRTVPHRTTPQERAVLFPAVVQLAQIAPVVVVYGNHDQSPDLDGLAHLDGQWPVRVCAGAGSDVIATPSGPLGLYWLAYPVKRWLLAGQPAPGVQAAQRAVQERLSMLCQLWGSKIKRARARHPDLCHVFAGHVQISGSRTAGGEVLAGQEIELSRDQLDGLGVDYGALGHIHRRQEVAPRCWYSGSPWRNDYAETEPAKVWHLVDVGDWRDVPPINADGSLPEVDGVQYCGDRRPDTRVLAFDTGCRRRVTLDYRWAQPDGEDGPRWTQGPAAIDSPDTLTPGVVGADVRMRLTVPQQWAASCPWDQEIERVRALGAHRVDMERVIEPVLRVRAPAVAQADTLPDKLAAYWTTTATELTDQERAAALSCLTDLQTLDDSEINPTGDHHATDSAL